MNLNIEKWPEMLFLARHGQSEANVAKDAARAIGAEPAWVNEVRDQDSPLTDLGCEQAENIGMYLADEYRDLDYILTSPFLRAKETTNLILEEFDTVDQGERTLPTVVVEERLREIEFGIMDGIDRKKFRELFPSEATRRERDGKYYYRPPGGENRPDVRLRVHSVLDTLNRDYTGKRVLIVCHSVVVLAFRSLLERWDETQYLQVDKEDDVKNCGLTVYKRVNNRKLVLQKYNFIAPTVIDRGL
jgi:broad specificity phosphatase PhoE